MRYSRKYHQPQTLQTENGFKANYAQNLLQQHHFHGPFLKLKKTNKQVKHAAMHFGENTLFLDCLCVY